mgnify:CR=1 FL=1
MIFFEDERVLINKQHNIISLWILVFIPFIYDIISQFISFHPVANECLLANIVLIFRALHGIKELMRTVDVFGKLHILLAKRVILWLHNISGGHETKLQIIQHLFVFARELLCPKRIISYYFPTLLNENWIFPRKVSSISLLWEILSAIQKVIYIVHHIS